MNLIYFDWGEHTQKIVDIDMVEYIEKVMGETWEKPMFLAAGIFKPHLPFYAPPEELTVVSRGEWIWRRDVINLISPNNASSNLIVGETYNPPGFWSGTPIHQHDRDQASSGESDHEEVYYHRFGWKQGTDDQFGPYGVQLLMDGKSLTKAYIIGDKSAFAIPGGCHPVVASPVSELLYLWGNRVVVDDAGLLDRLPVGDQRAGRAPGRDALEVVRVDAGVGQGGQEGGRAVQLLVVDAAGGGVHAEAGR